MCETARRLREIEVIFEQYNGQANAHDLWDEYEMLLDRMYAMLTSFISLVEKKKGKNRQNRQVHNIPKKIRNGFNNWISDNFKGLSAFTLVQLLKSETSMPHSYIEDMVYVDLFNLFVKKDTTEDTQNKFNACKDLVSCVSWL